MDEVKDIRDRALALEMYARQARNTDAERQAIQIRLRAERKCGELLAGDIERAARGRPDKMSDHPTLSDLHISRDQSSDWQRLAAIPRDAFEADLADLMWRPTTSGLLERQEARERGPLPQQYMDDGALWLWGRCWTSAACWSVTRTTSWSACSAICGRPRGASLRWSRHGWGGSHEQARPQPHRRRHAYRDRRRPGRQRGLHPAARPSPPLSSAIPPTPTTPTRSPAPQPSPSTGIARLGHPGPRARNPSPTRPRPRHYLGWAWCAAAAGTHACTGPCPPGKLASERRIIGIPRPSGARLTGTA